MLEVAENWGWLLCDKAIKGVSFPEDHLHEVIVFHQLDVDEIVVRLMMTELVADERSALKEDGSAAPFLGT